MLIDKVEQFLEDVYEARVEVYQAQKRNEISKESSDLVIGILNEKIEEIRNVIEKFKSY